MGVPERGLGAAEDVVRLARDARLGPPGAGGAGRARAQHGRLPRLPARARQGKVDDRADDYASALLAIHDEDPEALSHEEIASILFSLSFAGHETTNYLIGNLIRRLLEERSRWEAVVADRELIPGAVDETLRFDTSVPVWRRITTRPVTLGGVDLPEGAKLFLWLAATGRDPRRLPRPRPASTRARGRPPPPRVRQGHPLLRGREPRQARGAAGAGGADRALAGAAPGRGPAGPVPPEHLLPGPLALWVNST